jgi:predicted exporter
VTRALAGIWLLVVAAAGAYLTVLAGTGFPIRSDILALLPREARNPQVQLASDAVSRSLGRHFVLAFGAADRAHARAAADLAKGLIGATGLAAPLGGTTIRDIGRQLALFYYPYRTSLLGEADRRALTEDRGVDIARRAIAQAYGFGSPVDAAMLSADPFLLLPSFLTALPNPFGRLVLDDGLLTVQDGPISWVVLPMTLREEAFDLDVEDRLVRAVDEVAHRLAGSQPNLRMLRLGTVFFADQGARVAIGETTLLTVVETVGTVLLIVGVFRRFSPLLLNLLALGVGIVVAFGATFALFGEVHVAALLFGTSLIGVAVDYGLAYCATAFGGIAAAGKARLAYIIPAITLGLLTTLIGYGALAVAPFPGLRQIAVFAIVGLLAAFLTVALWFPLLDRMPRLAHGRRLLQVASTPWSFWTGKRWHAGRVLVVAACGVVLVTGLARYRDNDDVRRLQNLSPTLVAEQEELKRVMGSTTESQHLLVLADSDEQALRREEALMPKLDKLVAEGAIAGYLLPALFIPSRARQQADHALIEQRLLQPLLEQQAVQLGFAARAKQGDGDSALPLTLSAARDAKVLPFLEDLVVAPGLHIVTLQGLTRPDLVRRAASEEPDVLYIDPTANFSALLGAYRVRAIQLTVASIVLMVMVLAWRYGVRGAFWTILPPVTAALLVPATICLVGEPFTFFHAMGLVLVVAIAGDYAIFCAETGFGQESVTMLTILLATLTTLLSFGLLTVSSALAVRAFGFVMLIGIVAAYVLAPIAHRASRKKWLL